MSARNRGSGVGTRSRVRTELVVIGAGPAGLCASIEAARSDVDVVLLDENQKAGGQLIKQIHRFFGSEEHLSGVRGITIGSMLLEEAEREGVKTLFNTAAWGLFPDKTVGILRPDGVDTIRAERVVLATGALENSLAFPGWTLPNIMGAGAAQTMVNVHRVLPGRKVMIIGSGNVGLIVAYQLLQAGAEVVAIVEALPHVTGYQVHASKIVRMGVPILCSHTILRAVGTEYVEKAEIVRLDAGVKPVSGTERWLEVDLICIAVGLRPMAELAWMAGLRFGYIPELGGHVPLHDKNLQSTVPGIYIAGDAGGIEEASTAMEEGTLSGAAVASSLGRVNRKISVARIADIQRRLVMLRQGPFGNYRYEAKQHITEAYHRCEQVGNGDRYDR
ncbi:MAG: FAD-dependent oxidoreductase [Spirochaetaceae bacterium]|nr:MAG: FAD-dependent oxidoreductase [Spirochaetaceae bacterium]